MWLSCKPFHCNTWPGYMSKDILIKPDMRPTWPKVAESGRKWSQNHQKWPIVVQSMRFPIKFSIFVHCICHEYPELYNTSWIKIRHTWHLINNVNNAKITKIWLLFYSLMALYNIWLNIMPVIGSTVTHRPLLNHLQSLPAKIPEVWLPSIGHSG